MVFSQGIVERPVSFQLSPREASNRMALQYAKSSLLKEKDGAKLSEVAIKTGFNATELYFVRVKTEENGPKDSCRLSTLTLVEPRPYILACYLKYLPCFMQSMQNLFIYVAS